MYPADLENLIESLQFFPGIGRKTAERMAFSVMNMSDERVELLSSSIENVKKNIHLCSICNSFTDSEVCNICSNELRDNTILCVVEDPRSVFLFESLGLFKGK